MSGTYETQNPYFSGNIPTEIAENFKHFFPEDGDISYEEFLEQQEGVYQSIQASGGNNNLASYYGESSSSSISLILKDESSFGVNVESQLELDEALARSLQDVDDDFEHLNISHSDHDDFEHLNISHSDHVPVAENRDPAPEATPARVFNRNIREDDVDPDNMTYEELQSLGDVVGHESKGLSDEIISRLPTFKLKKSSRKRTVEECVICCAEYKSGAQLITLPCAHNYHSECIRQWLKLNKACPVCQAEVQENE